MFTQKIQPRLLLAGLALIALASCNKTGVAPGKGEDLTLSPVEQQQVAANNTFTLKLFKNLDSANISNDNLFISPLSVSFALGMTANGASGPTLAAMKNTMDFGTFTQDQANTYNNDLLTNLPKLDPATTLNIANSIWYRQTFNVLPQFLQTNTNYYHTEVQPLNFDSPAAITTINNWVSKQTSNKIPAIINSLSANDMMVLVNAIYFKSSWNEKFDATKTSKQPFYTGANSQVQADFMDGTIDFKRNSTNEATVFELPYANSKYSMVIVMPTTGTVQQLAQGIDSAKWQGWMAGLSPAKSDFKLPKFKFSFGASLKKSLTQLGMGIAFSDNANFSLINNTVPLQISDVIHKGFVEVDESGTTAAAATAVIVTALSTVVPVNVVDHPFIFAIREVKSGLILFAGTVNNPLLTGE